MDRILTLTLRLYHLCTTLSMFDGVSQVKTFSWLVNLLLLVSTEEGRDIYLTYLRKLLRSHCEEMSAELSGRPALGILTCVLFNELSDQSHSGPPAAEWL